VNSKRTSRRTSSRRAAAKRARRSAGFFGVRHPLGRFILSLLLLAAIGIGGYFAVAKHLLPLTENEDESSDALDDGFDEQQQALLEWQQSGPEGWERLFESSCQSWPGYVVDVGRPARLKLVELGPKIRPMMLRKLKSPDYNQRISAIYVLAEIGEPRINITHFLARELFAATERKHQIGALKCAAAVADNDTVVIDLSLAALESEHPQTRQLAFRYLFILRNNPFAPRHLTQRLLALLNDSDPKVRVFAAACLTEEDAPRTYRILLDGLDSNRNDVLLLAANHVATLRGGGRINPATATQDDVDKALEGHRRWLREKLRQ